MAGVYEVRPFPDHCQSELDCIVYVGSACVRHGLCACIHVQGVTAYPNNDVVRYDREG